MMLSILIIYSSVIAVAETSDSLQEKLFLKVLAGSNCKQTLNNGLICEYHIDGKLKFSIKDAGGSDTVIGFAHSDIKEEFYAIMYFGCIVIVPGYSHPRNYDRNYGVFISPNNGMVFRTRQECQSVQQN